MTAVLTTLTSFNGTNGAEPFDFNGLIADSKGDLFGTTLFGTVFELVNNNGTYTLNTLTAAIGFAPVGGVIADANGDLFGTTGEGGTLGLGTVFELVNKTARILSTPCSLSAAAPTEPTPPTV